MKKILVSGGLGFLGSHLVDFLLSKGNKLTIVDNLSTNAVPKDFFPKCEVVIQDIVKYKPKIKFDEIYHLASVVGPAGVLPYAGEIGYRMVSETKRVVDIAISQKAKLLYVSTSEVYGHDSRKSGFFKEDFSKIIPSKVAVRLAYGVGKLLAEIECLNKAKVTNLWVNIVRPFNIVGPRQSSDGGFVLARFIDLALKGEPITVYGDGKQRRSITHVKDIVSGMFTVMNSNVRNEIFNLGNPNNVVSIGNLAGMVKKLVKSKSKIIKVDPKTVYGPLFEDVPDKLPDVSKMYKFFKWKPKINLQKTVLETIGEYKNRPDAKREK